jgi:peptidyl-prolyl cis-trans isomerase C
MRYLVATLLLLFSLSWVAAQSGGQSVAQSGGQSGGASAQNPVVLQLGNHSVTLNEFNQRFQVYANTLASQQGIQLTPQMLPMLNSLRPSFLDQLADQFVLIAYGEAHDISVPPGYVDEQINDTRKNFDSDDAYQKALKQAGFGSEALLRKLIGEAELSNLTVAALQKNITVTDDQLQQWYKSHTKQFTTPEEVCVRHILVKTEDEAKVVEADLKAGADFATEAKKKSIDTASAKKGGDLGCIAKGQTVKPFEDAAFNTPIGTVSKPIKSQYGYHIILPYKHEDAQVQPFDKVKDQVKQAVTQEELGSKIEDLRKKSDVKTYPDLVAVKPPSSPSGGASQGNRPSGSGGVSGGGVSGGSASGGNSAQ